MKSFRPSLAFVALALVGALLAPSASLGCEAREHRCPGMPPELAALCHQAGTMAPDCCQDERPSPERPAASQLSAPAQPAETPTLLDAASSACEALGVAHADFSRDASFHELGLFTLHAVFRI